MEGREDRDHLVYLTASSRACQAMYGKACWTSARVGSLTSKRTGSDGDCGAFGNLPRPAIQHRPVGTRKRCGDVLASLNLLQVEGGKGGEGKEVGHWQASIGHPLAISCPVLPLNLGIIPFGGPASSDRRIHQH